MKKLIIALFCLTTGIIKAQDSIGIDSTDFTVQSSNFYLDTLDFTYYPSKSGTQSIEQIRTRVDVSISWDSSIRYLSGLSNLLQKTAIFF